VKALLALCLAGLLGLAASATAGEPKVLRYAFRAAETGFDPSQLSDLYSRCVTSHIFESLYTYDHLARPAKIVPLIADGMPEVSVDFKTFTVKLKRGIYFADDPVFKGQRREVTAHDFVFSIKRFADPALKSPGWASFDDAGLLGLAALRGAAIQRKTPFNYEAPVEGLRALDRYTLQFKTEQARPRLVQQVLAGNDLYGALAHEVVAHYGDKIAEHPVGTGPFVMKAWRRSSKIVLERNPTYRERFYEAQPAADDAEGLAILARLKGRRLPMLDRVEVAITEEAQPRWLSFLTGEQDFVELVPEDYINQALPGGKLAPNLAKRGIQAFQVQRADVTLTVFNMEDPTLGGYAPDKVALRRAIGLALDTPGEIRLVRRGQAVPAQSQLVPNTIGFDPAFKSEMSDFDPARARALLDMYGYLDRDGDGWRELPNGQPLILVRNTQSDSQYRQLDELWQKNLSAVGLRLTLKVAQWPENLKLARSGRFMMWPVGSSASQPDGQEALQRFYGPAAGGQNLARFHSPAFDQIYEQMQGMADGPAREALFLQAKRIGISFMPYKNHVHRIVTDMAQRGLIGYRRPVFWQDWWQFVDSTDSSRQKDGT
jgi:ABC-type transport system substrate-binding protein